MRKWRLDYELKGKVVPVLNYKYWALRHEDIWGSGLIAPPFLTFTLDEVEWSAPRLCGFAPGVGAPGTHWIGGWVGPRAGVDAVEKRKILHCRETNPDRPVRRCTGWAFPTFSRLWHYNETSCGSDVSAMRPHWSITFKDCILNWELWGIHTIQYKADLIHTAFRKSTALPSSGDFRCMCHTYLRQLSAEPRVHFRVTQCEIHGEESL
jgi:hypothetical protein